MTLFIDTAEPDYMSDLFADLGVDVVRCRIYPSGDYAFGTDYSMDTDGQNNHVTIVKGVIVERKTIADFDQGFVNNNPHVWDQLQRMQEAENIRAVWVIIGDSDELNPYSNVTPNQRIGAYTSALVRYPNVNISFIGSEQSFIYQVKKMYKAYWENKYGVGRPLPFKGAHYGSFGEYIFAGVTGVGKKRAEELAEAFGIRIELIPLDWASGISQLEDIKGVGKKVADKIREELDLYRYKYE